jgi:hypothetical protein
MPSILINVLHVKKTKSTFVRMGEKRGAYRILVGRPEGRRPLGRRNEDNIKMDLQDVGWGAWTGLSWLRIGTGGWLL